MKMNLYLILYIILTLNLYSQNPKQKGLLEIDFSVPDIPAMKSLGVENSNILRPTTPGELGIQLSKRFDDGNFTIPSALAIEFKPFDLSYEVKANEFENFKNNFRISLGSIFDTISKMSFYSFGFRYTLDYGFSKELNLINNKKKDEILRLRSELISNLKLKYAGNLEKLENDPMLNKEADDYAYNIYLDSLKSEVNNNYWNKSKIDIATAISFSSKDSTGTEPEIRSYNAWLTFSLGIDKWGQLLLGGSFRYYKEELTQNHLSGSLGLRLYGGTNILKAFIEISGISDNLNLIKNSLLVNGGLEFKITKGTWLVYNLGWIDDLESGSSKFKTNLDFKYNIAEIINFINN